MKTHGSHGRIWIPRPLNGSMISMDQVLTARFYTMVGEVEKAQEAHGIIQGRSGCIWLYHHLQKVHKSI